MVLSLRLGFTSPLPPCYVLRLPHSFTERREACSLVENCNGTDEQPACSRLRAVRMRSITIYFRQCLCTETIPKQYEKTDTVTSPPIGFFKTWVYIYIHLLLK